ncbi:MAG: hypothetical protein WD468_11790 [Pirellulales bacterium]
MRRTFATALIVAFSLASRTTAGLVDNFNRADSDTVGTTSENPPNLVWDERTNTGAAETGSVVRIQNDQLYIGSSHLTPGGSGVGGVGYGELGPFSNDLVLQFDMAFSAITSSDAPGTFERWGIETQIQVRHPDNAAMAGSTLPSGAVAVSFYPNGNIHVRSADGSGLLDDRFYNSSGTLQTGNASHDTDPDTTFTMTGTHAIKLSLVGTALQVFVDDLVTPKVSTTISASVPALTTNYIALGKFLRTTTGVEARYDVAFDNLAVSVPIPEVSSFLLVGLSAFVVLGCVSVRRKLKS